MSETLQITLNGEARKIPVAADALALIGVLDLAGKRLAMEVNGEILPRSQFSGHRFHDGDQIEIIHAVGGG